MNNNTKAKKSKDKKPIELLEKCKDKKERNIKFQNFINNKVSDRMLDFINQCGSFIQMIGNKDISVKKLINGNFCKNRFCPFCSWRRSLKEAYQIMIIMEHLQKEENQEFYFLTLTSPNVKGDSLEEEIKHYNNSFQRLMQLKEVKGIVNGYVRKLEVTYNSNEYISKNMYKQKKAYYDYRGLTIGDLEPNYNTYHPHFHVILSVDRNSIMNKKEKWIDKEKWLELWKKSTRNDSITQVDFQKIREVGEGKEAFEIAKYSSKDSDYLYSQEVFDIFYNALKGKQLIVYSGLFKEGVKLYKKGDLDVYKKQDKEEYIYMLLYSWADNLKDYEEYKKRELTPEEYKKFNKNLIDEMGID